MKKMHVLPTLSVIYLFIETQALLLLSKIYTDVVPVSSLSEYERFGYASAGLGVCLLFIKYIASKKDLSHKLLCSLFLAPFVYMISVWAVYETVQRSPFWINDELKPRAMRATVNTLSSPSFNNALSFFLDRSSTSDEIEQRTATMLQNYPSSDRVIQGTYIEGMKSVDLFARYYQSHAEALDTKLWNKVWKDGKRLKYYTERDRYTRDNINVLWGNAARAEQSSISPLSIERLATLYTMKIEFPAIYQHSKLENIQGNSLFLTKKETLSLSSETVSWDVWREIGEDFSIWPTYHHDKAFLEQFRAAYSQGVLGKYAYIPNAIMPWYHEEKNPLSSDVYRRALFQISPFLFNKQGEPLISISRLYNDDKRSRYITRIARGLPEELKDNWIVYQKRTISSLSHSTDAWLKPTDKSLHIDLLRVGVITPILLLLSLILILTNLVLLFKENIIVGVVGATASAAALLSIAPPLTKALIELLLMISVKEANIFLF